MNKYKRIIVALDVEDYSRARYFLKLLSPHLRIFKIGPRLFIPYGKRIVELVKSYGGEVFLDLKLHDIPTQVAKSVAEIAKMGVKMFTVHALGGRGMLEEASRVLNGFPPQERPCMLAVTLLTSLDKKDLHFLDFKNKISILVFKLAELALSSGADGIVCSGKEVGEMKRKLKRNFIAVVPGIRLSKSYSEQKRQVQPEEAFRNGADYIVVGRAILDADDPLNALKEVAR